MAFRVFFFFFFLFFLFFLTVPFSNHRIHRGNPVLKNHTTIIGGELGWPNYGSNRLGRSVYGPYPFLWCNRGVSVAV